MTSENDMRFAVGNVDSISHEDQRRYLDELLLTTTDPSHHAEVEQSVDAAISMINTSTENNVQSSLRAGSFQGNVAVAPSQYIKALGLVWTENVEEDCCHPTHSWECGSISSGEDPNSGLDAHIPPSASDNVTFAACGDIVHVDAGRHVMLSNDTVWRVATVPILRRDVRQNLLDFLDSIEEEKTRPSGRSSPAATSNKNTRPAETPSTAASSNELVDQSGVATYAPAFTKQQLFNLTQNDAQDLNLDGYEIHKLHGVCSAAEKTEADDLASCKATYADSIMGCEREMEDQELK